MTGQSSATTELEYEQNPNEPRFSVPSNPPTNLKKKDSIHQGTLNLSEADTPSPISPHHDGQQNDITRSPLYCPVPTNADPTVVLAMRFQGSSIINCER